MVRHGFASRSEAATVDCFLSHSPHRLPLLAKSVQQIAHAQQNILRVNAEPPYWSCKMAAQFLSTMRMTDRLAADGRSSAAQKVFGGSPRWQRYAMDCSNSMIPSQTRLPSGRATRANRRLRFANCSAKPTALKAPRCFNAHRFGTETPWQFGCQLLLNPARRSFMVRVIFRFFASCCAGNWEAAAPSHTSRDTYPAGLGLAASTTKKILSAIRYRRQDLS